MLNNKFNILIAMGSFKDVFTPKESLELIKNIIFNIDENIHVDSCSVSDGGEFSHEIVKKNFNCQEIEVNNVINPYKKKVTSSYLILEDNSAFVSSSHILRLLPEDDKYKNPLNLTSFGLGQLLKDAFDKGIKKIFLGLGGTNTIDAGIGMLQALGVEFNGKYGENLLPYDKKYFSGCDLENINSIVSSDIKFFKNIEVISLCDGIRSISEMNIPNIQKIGSNFQANKQQILDSVSRGLESYSKVCNIGLSKDYFGVAGGINLSLSYLFNLEMKLGIGYFIELLDIEKKIINFDLVITGEGKLDNSFGGKTPVGISKIAKKHNKPVLYLVGDVEDKYKLLFDNDLANDLPCYMQKNGITSMISCHYFNSKFKEGGLGLDAYKKNTPIVFERSIKNYLISKGYIK